MPTNDRVPRMTHGDTEEMIDKSMETNHIGVRIQRLITGVREKRRAMGLDQHDHHGRREHE